MRIAVDAYFNNNLGDDLFLDILVERYKDVTFDFMLCDEMACKAFIDHPRVNYKSRKEVVRNIIRYDAYIFIGGSMFQEPKEWKKAWRKFDLTVSIFKLFRKSAFVLGCNFGPYKTVEYKEKYLRTFRKLTHMTVRDQYSFDLLKDKGINMTLHPDIVLSKKCDERESRKSNIVGISIINWPKNNNEKGYIEFNVNLIKELLNENKIVRLFSFQNTSEISDNTIINNVLKGLDRDIQNKVDVISYDGNIKFFLEKYSQCDSMVTARFHSLIMSLINGQAIYSLVYSEKTLNTMKFLGIDLEYTWLEEVSIDSVKTVKKVLIESEEVYIKKEIVQLVKDAQGHFVHLDNLFRK
ncbi:polysaccharide pyruvyl transferase family protein [Bacillus thuringiensis]|uniref:polysaccharide pyruvyl transferase family protein n=1 Tax=Bacillus thuringiensis TaxID=1428 RepID=UPI0011A959D0|nr:polysaccharide pyruvyl transferase family protein [Bacillus thuringiensis]